MAYLGGSRSIYWEVENQKDTIKLFHIYWREVVQKYFINQETLWDHDTFAIKAKFYGKDKEDTIMCLPKNMHALQKEECTKVFSLIDLNNFF